MVLTLLTILFQVARITLIVPTKNNLERPRSKHLTSKTALSTLHLTKAYQLIKITANSWIWSCKMQKSKMFFWAFILIGLLRLNTRSPRNKNRLRIRLWRKRMRVHCFPHNSQIWNLWIAKMMETYKLLRKIKLRPICLIIVNKNT